MAEFIRSPMSYESTGVNSDVWGLYNASEAIMRQNDQAYRRLQESINARQANAVAADKTKEQQQSVQKSLIRAGQEGRIDLTEAVIRRPTQEGFVWDNYYNGKDSVSITSQSANTRSWLGYNAYAFGQQYAGLNDDMDLVSAWDSSGHLKKFREAGEEAGVDFDSGWGIARSFRETASGVIGHWITGDQNAGAMTFTEGGTMHDLLYHKDKDWSQEGGQDEAISYLLNPDTPAGAMWLEMGLTEEFIRDTPNAAALAFALNQKQHQYIAGQTTAEFSTMEGFGQFAYDIGIGFVTDPDAVVEAGVMAVVGAATGGLGIVGGAAAGAARLASMGAKAKRIGGLMKMTAGTLNGFHTATKAAKSITRIPGKLLPTTIAEELVVPAIRNFRMAKSSMKSGDEATELAGTVLDELQKRQGTPSLVLDSMYRAFADDTAGVSKLANVTSNVIDGAVGELFAYGLSRDEEYAYQRFVNGTAVSRADFDASLGGYIESGLTGAIFGGAISTAFSIGGGALRNSTGFVQFMGENYTPGQGGLKQYWGDYRKSVEQARMASRRGNIFARLAEVTGDDKLNLAKDFFKERMKANGAKKADIETAHKMLDHAFKMGVDMEKLVKKVGPDLANIAMHIDAMSNSEQAAARALAFEKINGLNLTPEGRREVMSAYELSKRINMARVQKALKDDTLISDVDPIEVIRALAKTDKDARILLGKLEAKSRKEHKMVLDVMAESGFGDLDDSLQLKILSEAYKTRYGRELTKEQFEGIKESLGDRKKAQEALDAEDIRGNSTNARNRFLYWKNKLKDKSLKPFQRQFILDKMKEERKTFESLRTEERADAELLAASAGGTLADGPMALPEAIKSRATRALDLDKEHNQRVAEILGTHTDSAFGDTADIMASDMEPDAAAVQGSLSAMIKAMSKNTEHARELAAEFGVELNDARNEGATYTVKEMIAQTKKNLEKVMKEEGAARVAELKENAKKHTRDEHGRLHPPRVLAQMIQDDHKVDVGMPESRDGKQETVLPTDFETVDEAKESLAELWETIHVIRQLENEDLLDDQVYKDDKFIAEEIYDGMVQLERHVAREGINPQAVPLEVVINFFPPGHHHLLTNVFEQRAGTRVRTPLGHTVAFNMDALKTEAALRLSRADDAVAAVELAKVRRRMVEGKDKFDATIRNRRLNKDSHHANKRALEKDIMNAVQVRAQERADAAMEAEGFDPSDPESRKAYVDKHRPGLRRGIIDAWSKIPEGPLKVTFAKRIGIDGLTRSNNDLFKPVDEVHKVNRAEVDRLSGELEDAVNIHLEQVYGITLDSLIDGTVDAQNGYTVGRAVIEALAPHREVGTKHGQAYSGEAAGVAEARRGWIGNMSTSALSRIHEEHIKQEVIGHLLFKDKELTELREFSDADIQRTYDWYKEIQDEINRLEELNWPETETQAFLDKYVQDDFYEGHRDRTFAPTRTIRSLQERMGNFRQMVDRRVSAIENSSPAIIKTLHDEVAGPRSFLGSMFIVGKVPDAADAFIEGVTADFGLKGAVVTPASFKQAWQIRTGNTFGSVKGVADIAALAGARNLSQFLKDLGDDRLTFLAALGDLESGGLEFEVNGKTLTIHNDEDASAQAVTAAQSIWKDYLALTESEDLPPNQKDFNKFLEKVRGAARKDWGGAEMAAQIEDYSAFTTTKGPDNYSIVGLEALKRMNKKGSGWSTVLKLLAREMPEKEEGKTPTLKDGGKFGNALRKEIFKRPVMTLPYSAGTKAFKNAIEAGIEEIKANPAKYGVTAEEVAKLDSKKMAKEMAEMLYEDAESKKEGVEGGLIEEMLGIPKSQQNLKAIQETNQITIPTADGEATITPAEVANGSWESDPQKRAWAVQKAKNMFGIEDPAASLMMADYYLKMRMSLNSGDLNKSQFNARMKAAREFMQKPPSERGEWNTISSYVATAEHTGRMGFLADYDQVQVYMDDLGIELHELSPEAAAQIMGYAAYYPKGTGFSRAFAGTDAAQAQRDKSGATGSADTTGEGDTQLGQYDLADTHEGLGGFAEWDADPETRRSQIEKAVLTDEIVNMSSVFKPPPGLDEARPYEPQSPGEFFADSVDDADVDLQAARQNHENKLRETLDKANEIEEKIARYRETKAEEDKPTADEIDLYNRADQIKKILARRDEDGRLTSTNNNNFIAADRQARYRVSHSDPRNFGTTAQDVNPSQGGVAALRFIHTATEDKLASVGDGSGRAFSLEERTVASPYSPEWVDKTTQDGYELLSADERREELANFGEEPPKVLEAELESERELAETRGVEVTTLRANRLAQRARQANFFRVRSAVSAVENNEAGAEQRFNAAITQSLINLDRAMETTFGGFSAEDVQERGSFSIFDIDASGKTIPGLTDATPLEALQAYARMNSLNRMVGLSLGPVNTPGLRVANPSVDNVDATDMDQSSNRVMKTTSRGPYSIFSRDWAIMGGSHIDAVTNMIDLMASRMTDNDGNLVGREGVMDKIKREGFFEVYSTFVGDKMEQEGDLEFLNHMGQFTSENLGDKSTDLSIDEKRMINQQFDEMFDRAIVNHGLNPRIAVELDGEEKMVLLEIVEQLSFPPNLNWFKKALNLREDITPIEVAVAFAEPDTQKKLMFLKPYEDVKQINEETGEVETVREYQTFGDIVNGMEMVDPKLQQDARPVYTEMGILNMFNATSNRKFMRKFILANTFGVDVAAELTNSERLAQGNADPFTGPNPPMHGFVGTPRSKKGADTRREEGRDGWSGPGYNAEKHGKYVKTKYDITEEVTYKKKDKEGKWKAEPVSEEAYGIAEMLMNFGLLGDRTDGSFGIHGERWAEIYEVVKKMAGEDKPPFSSELVAAARAIRGKRKSLLTDIKNIKSTVTSIEASKKAAAEIRAKIAEKKAVYSSVLSELDPGEYIARRDAWRAENPGTYEDMPDVESQAAYLAFVTRDGELGLVEFSTERLDEATLATLDFEEGKAADTPVEAEPADEGDGDLSEEDLAVMLSRLEGDETDPALGDRDEEAEALLDLEGGMTLDELTGIPTPEQIDALKGKALDKEWSKYKEKGKSRFKTVAAKREELKRYYGEKQKEVDEKRAALRAKRAAEAAAATKPKPESTRPKTDSEEVSPDELAAMLDAIEGDTPATPESVTDPGETGEVSPEDMDAMLEAIGAGEPPAEPAEPAPKPAAPRLRHDHPAQEKIKKIHETMAILKRIPLGTDAVARQNGQESIETMIHMIGLREDLQPENLEDLDNVLNELDRIVESLPPVERGNEDYVAGVYNAVELTKINLEKSRTLFTARRKVEATEALKIVDEWESKGQDRASAMNNLNDSMLQALATNGEPKDMALAQNLLSERMYKRDKAERNKAISATEKRIAEIQVATEKYLDDFAEDVSTQRLDYYYDLEVDESDVPDFEQMMIDFIDADLDLDGLPPYHPNVYMTARAADGTEVVIFYDANGPTLKVMHVGDNGKMAYMDNAEATEFLRDFSENEPKGELLTSQYDYEITHPSELEKYPTATNFEMANTNDGRHLVSVKLNGESYNIRAHTYEALYNIRDSITTLQDTKKFPGVDNTEGIRLAEELEMEQAKLKELRAVPVTPPSAPKAEPPTPAPEAAPKPKAAPKAEAPAPVEETGDDIGVSEDELNAILANLESDPSSVPFTNSPEPEKRGSAGRVYLNMLDSMYSKTGDIMWANQANLVRHLTDPKNPDSISDDEAIALVEWAVIDDDMRSAIYGGGRIEWADGGVVKMKIDYSEKGNIKSKLHGLQVVKQAVKRNDLQLGSFLLVHELVERMLSVARESEIDGGENAKAKQGLIRRLKSNVVKDMVDDDGWRAFIQFMEEVGFRDMGKNDKGEPIRHGIIKELRKVRAEALRSVRGEVKEGARRHGKMLQLPRKIVTAIANGMKGETVRGVEPGREREATTEMMAMWLTTVVFREGAARGVNADTAGTVASHLMDNHSRQLDAVADRIANKAPEKSKRGLFARLLRKMDKRVDRARDESNIRVSDPTTGEGQAYMYTAGANVFAPTESSMFGGMMRVVRDLAEIANDAFTADEVEFKHETVTRHAGGGLEVSSKIEDARDELLAATEERNKTEIGTREFYNADARVRAAEQALRSIERSHDPEIATTLDNAREKAKFDETSGTRESVMDLRRVTPHEKFLIIDDVADKLVTNFDVKRSNAAGSLIYGLGTLGSFASTFQDAGSHENPAIRGLMAMLDPTGVNTKETPAGYIPVQFSTDYIQTQFAEIRNILSPVRTYLNGLDKKVGKGKMGPDDGASKQKQLLAAIEQGDPKKIHDMDLPKNVKRAALAYQAAMFDKESGLFMQFINVAERDGKISASEANRLRAKPRLPYQLERSHLDSDSNFQDVRKDVAAVMRNEQMRLLPTRGKVTIDHDMAVDAGIFFPRDLNASNKDRIVRNMPDDVLDAYKQVARFFFSNGVGRPSNWDRMETWQRVDWVQEQIKANIFAKDKKEAPGGFKLYDDPSMKLIATVMRRSLESGAPEWAKIEVDGQMATPAQYRLHMREKEMERSSGRGTSKRLPADPGVGGFKANNMVLTWRNGGHLSNENMLFKDPRTAAGLKALHDINGGNPPAWLGFQINNVNTLTNSLMGSTLVESFSSVANQHLTGVKGVGPREIISSLRSRIENNEPIPVGTNEDGSIKYDVIPESKKRGYQQVILDVENQYLVGIGRTPKDMKVPTRTERNILALSRLGTTLVSAPQWVMSTLSETMQLTLQTAVRTVLLGDFKAFTDFIRPLSKSQRKQLYTQVNLFHNQFDRNNIGIKTGQYFLDQVRDLDQKAQDRTVLERLDGNLRWLGTAGFGKMTRYNRYVMAARQIRALKRAANKPKFTNFLNQVAANPDMTVKEITALGRKSGVERNIAFFLANSGIGKQGTANQVQNILMNMTDDAGVRFGDINRAISKAQQEGRLEEAEDLMRSAQLVSGLLQQLNTTINIEPRMGTKSIPRGIYEQMLSSLTQFPVLALHNIGRMARAGGVAGGAAYLVYLIMGDTMYETLKDLTVRGKSTEQLMLEWETDPQSATLNVLNKAMVGGTGGMVVKAGMLNVIAETMAKIDPTFAQGFRKQSRMERAGNMAGIGMLQSGANDLFGIFGHIADGDWDQAGMDALKLSPIPARPAFQFALSRILGESVYARLNGGQGRGGGGGAGTGGRGYGSGSRGHESVGGSRYGGSMSGMAPAETAQGPAMPPEGSQMPPEAVPAPPGPETPMPPETPVVADKAPTGKKEHKGHMHDMLSHKGDHQDLKEMM